MPPLEYLAQSETLRLTVEGGTFFPGLDGFEEVTDFDMDIFRLYVPDIAAFTESGHKPGETVLCTGKIKHVGSTYVDQWNYLKNQRNAILSLRVPP